jgi:hypothetical protein
MVANKPDLSQFKSDSVKFVEPKDSIAGRLVDMSIENGIDKDKDVLKLVIKDHETGMDRPVWCPTMLAARIAELDPDIGQFITITLTGFRNVGRPSPLKEFEVTVSDEEPY